MPRVKQSILRYCAQLLVALSAATMAKSVAADVTTNAPGYDVEYEFNVRIPMRDGTL